MVGLAFKLLIHFTESQLGNALQHFFYLTFQLKDGSFVLPEGYGQQCLQSQIEKSKIFTLFHL
jgi:hypothetical protein